MGRRVGVAPALLLLAFLLPAPRGAHVAGIPSLCAFRNVTGLPCPGCGITRSVVCCAHGLWGEAVAYHPLGLPVFAGLLGLTAARLAVLARPGLRWSVPGWAVAGGTWAAAAVVAAIWLARLAHLLPAPP